MTNETNLNIEAIDANLKEKYINDVDTILSLIKNLNLSHSGFLGVPGQTSNLEKNQSGEFLDAFLEEPYPTSHYAYVMRVQELYRLIFQKAKQAVLEGDNSLWSRLFNLKTAMFPIKLKIKLDGIDGFKQGNSITTNWLPTGYSNKNCYFTILKISHTISNNDWYTELEAIYRVIL
jgi:hypothetical protein